MLQLRDNIAAYIVYTPDFATGFFTSGNVLVTISWNDISGDLHTIITNNGTYAFPYMRWTGPYISGMAYGPTNLWTNYNIIGTITWIDKIPPIYSIVPILSGFGVSIFYSDNNPGAMATVNGFPYSSWFPITAPGTYTFVVNDVARNTTWTIFTLQLPICGNGTTEPPEYCDDGPNNGQIGYCNTTCTGIIQSVCGDGIIEVGENCDDGPNNGMPGYCNLVCNGPSVLGCMDSGANNYNPFANVDDGTCSYTICGDGIVEIGETCDDWAYNWLSWYCNVQCTAIIPLAPVCGNGLVETGESCDSGIHNGQTWYCNTQCTGVIPLVPVCGNGLVETGESCDNGTYNWLPWYCNAQCSGLVPGPPPVPVCGNSIVETGEICDSGIHNGQAGYCNSVCSALLPINGWWPVLIKDNCPNGDFSPSYYDYTCGHWAPSSPEDEVTSAYNRAYNLGITTMYPIENANVYGYIKRSQLAKMISKFTMQFTNIKLNILRDCIFPDMEKESLEMQYYAVIACQYGLMWLEEDGNTPKANFDPNLYVNRAQFGTVLSRLLFGDTYNIQDNERNFFVTIRSGMDFFVLNTPHAPLMWYSKHLQALKEAGIMMRISTPMMLELRGYVMLMLMRTDVKWLVHAR